MINFSRIKDICYSTFVYPFSFKHFGKRSKLVSPLRIDGSKNILIGDKVFVGYKAWLAAMPLTGENCILKIGNSCHIGNFNHFFSTKQIVIEDNVLTADKVCIMDNSHDYSDPIMPIWKQSIKQLSPVVIGEGSWLGENVCVLGASVGKHCVIGANSTVIDNIEDYCVAVGSPAKVIKRYNFTSNQWERV